MREVNPEQSPDVAFRVIEGAAVLVVPEDSSLYWLNPAATCIWQQADGRRSVEAIADGLRAEFDIDAETALRDTVEMVEAFTASGLFTVAASA